MKIEEAGPDATRAGARLAETGLRKVWSILDAAHEKPTPSQYLKPDAVQAIQGR